MLAALLLFGFSNLTIDILSGGDRNDPEGAEMVREHGTVAQNNEAHNGYSTERVIVKEIIDGDTIRIERQGGVEDTVRFLLIDTPETVHPDRAPEPFGQEATQFVREHLIRDTVITIEIGENKRDRYDRLLAHVYKDEMNLNLKLVEEGLARVAFIYEPNTKYLEEFKEMESKAKEDERGVWSIEGYVTEDGFSP